MDRANRWLERAELVGIVVGAFYVGWVLASGQLWVGEGIRPRWGLYLLGVPLGIGLVWPRWDPYFLRLVQALLVRIGLGSWALVGGWSLARPEIPWPIIAHIVPLIVSIHIPVALMARPWSPRAQQWLHRVGWLSFCLAAASALALALWGYYFPKKFWPRMLPFVVGLPILYRRMCSDPQRVHRGLVLIVLLLGVVNGCCSPV